MCACTEISRQTLKDGVDVHAGLSRGRGTHWVCLSQGSQVKAVEASDAEVTPAVKGSVFLGCQAWPLLFPLLGVALPFSCQLFGINSTSRASWTGPGREGATPLKGFHGASGGGACALTQEAWG